MGRTAGGNRGKLHEGNGPRGHKKIQTERPVPAPQVGPHSHCWPGWHGSGQATKQSPSPFQGRRWVCSRGTVAGLEARAEAKCSQGSRHIRYSCKHKERGSSVNQGQRDFKGPDREYSVDNSTPIDLEDLYGTS